PVSDEIAVGFGGVSGQPGLRQDEVAGVGEVVQGVDEGAVEVEEVGFKHQESSLKSMAFGEMRRPALSMQAPGAWIWENLLRCGAEQDMDGELFVVLDLIPLVELRAAAVRTDAAHRAVDAQNGETALFQLKVVGLGGQLLLGVM